MFGTLVIQLPSNYKGGQLVVRHQGKKETFDFSGIKGSTGFHYAAFYADCQHEILEVTQGYRLCLIYNLIYKGPGAPPVPADNRELVAQVVGSMTEWAADDSGPLMMAYLLEHQYCDASLSFGTLKNTDRAVADLLQNARREMNFDLYLTTVTKTECWSGSHSFGCHHYGPCNGSCDYETYDLIDDNLSASGWVTPSGKREDFGEIQLDEEVLVPPGVLDDADPDDEDFQEATGNEGATIDKTYHRASLVVWPLNQRLAMLGLDRMILKLEESIIGHSDLPQDCEEWKQSQQLAKDLIALSRGKKPSVASAASLLHSLQPFRDHELTCQFLSNLFSTSCPSSIYSNTSSSSYVASNLFGDQLLATCNVLGWRALQSCLCLIFGSSAPNNTEACCQLLFKLVCETSHAALTPERQDVCRQLASIICTVIRGEHDIAANLVAPSYSWLQMHTAHGPRSKDFVCQIFKILTILHCDTQLDCVLATFFQQENRYPLLTVLVPAAQELHQWVDQESTQSVSLLSHCIKTLEARTRDPIVEPTNWRQSVSLGCSCGDCQELQAFLNHPTQTQTGFKVKKSRRAHLHQQLDRHNCDATHQTLRQGSPQTLIVTKTRRSFMAKQQQRKREVEVLARLRSLCQPSASQPAPKRQKVAVVDLT